MPVKDGLKGAAVILSVAGRGTECGRCHHASRSMTSLNDELEQICRFIEEGDEQQVHALVEKYWPWLLEHAPPRVTH